MSEEHGANEGVIKKSPLGLRIIGMVKLVSASLLVAVGFGIFHLLGSDLGDATEHFIRHLHMDPANKFIVKIIADASGISQKELKAIDAGTFLYALLYVVEGVGLLLAKHWAEYLTIIATASLVPFEIYEIVRKLSAVRVGVFVINIAIICYMFYRLRADRRLNHTP